MKSCNNDISGVDIMDQITTAYRLDHKKVSVLLEDDFRTYNCRTYKQSYCLHKS